MGYTSRLSRTLTALCAAVMLLILLLGSMQAGRAAPDATQYYGPSELDRGSPSVLERASVSRHAANGDPMQWTDLGNAVSPATASYAMDATMDGELIGGTYDGGPLLYSYDIVSNEFSTAIAVPRGGGGTVEAVASGQGSLVFANVSRAFQQGYLLEYDTSTGSVTDLGDLLGEYGYGLTVGADGRVWVGSCCAGSVRVYNPVDGSWTNLGTTLGGHHRVTGLETGADGAIYAITSYIWTSTTQSARLYRIDPTTLTPTSLGQIWPGLREAWNVAYNAYDDALYITVGRNMNPRLLRYDIQGADMQDLGELHSSVTDIYPGMLTVAWDGKVYVTVSTQMKMYDPANPGAGIIDLGPRGTGGRPMAFGPDGRMYSIWGTQLMRNESLYSSPALYAVPNSVPADGATTATLVLSGASPGHEVRFVSSRGNLDTLSPIAGTVDTLGQYAGTIYSAEPGMAVVTAQDLTTGTFFGATTGVTFYAAGGQPPPPAPNNASLAIVDVRSQFPLDGRFLYDIPANNQIDVTVDWQDTTPWEVEFNLNGLGYNVPTSGNQASFTLDMGRSLLPGSNSLRIIARSAEGETSLPVDYSPALGIPPIWLIGLQETGLLSLPILESGAFGAGNAYEIGFEYPIVPLAFNAPNFGVSGTETGGGFKWKGRLIIPLDCTTPLLGTLGREGSGFKFLGATIEVDGYGGLEADRVPICGFAPPHLIAGFEIEGERNIVRKPVLIMIPYLNPGLGITVEQIVTLLQIEDLIGKMGEFYIDGKLHGGFVVEPRIELQSPFIHLRNLEFELGAGIEGGFRSDIKVVEVKIWAGADGTFRFIRMGDLTWPPASNLDHLEFDSIILMGEVGARFRTGWFVREATGNIEWVYPPSAEASAAMFERLAPEDWQLIAHMTAGEDTIFAGNAAGRHPFTRAMLPSASGTVTSTLVSNVYTYTEPALAVNANDEALMLWVHDVLTKPVGQAHEINYSFWDGAAWSAPTGLTDDDRLDGYPQVAWADDGSAVAVWQRLDDTLPVTATWDVTTAQKIEIATSNYNPAAGSWTPVSLLTTNSALDATPVLARNGAGQLLAIWRQNDAGLLSGSSSDPDEIVAAFYSAGWSAPAPAVTNVPGLVELAAAYGNGAATIVHSRLLTPTGGMTPTLQLFTSNWDGISWSDPAQLTDDGLGHTNPQVVYSNANQPLLVWLAGDTLRLQNLSSSSVVSLTLPANLGAIDEFELVQDAAGNLAAVFTAQSGQRDLYVSFFDQAHNLWGNPTPLTHDKASEGYPAPALDSSGRLLMGYASTAIHDITRTTTISATGELITFTLPVEGQTDLVTLAHVFTRNLTLQDSDVAVSDAYPIPGSSVVLSATVHNSGDLAVSGVTVDFYDGDPAAGGLLVGSSSLVAPLAAGFSRTLTQTYTVPTNGGIRSLYAIADPGGAIMEADENDNQGVLPAFGPDLVLSAAAVEYWSGSDVGLRSLIENIGVSSAPTTTIAFYTDALTGTLVATHTVPMLATGEVVTLTTPWNFGALSQGTHLLWAVANEGSFTETVMANNARALTLAVQPDLMISPYYLWTSSMTETTVLVTATLFNVGPVTATNVVVDFFGRDTLAGEELVLSQTISSLAPASAVMLTGTVSGPLGCGLFVQVDPARAITETIESNNLAAYGVGNGRCAGFVLTPSTGIAPLNVTFTSTATGDNDQWLWAFGDGITSSLSSPSHTYTLPGVYSVTQTVSGATGSDSFTRANAVTVYEPAQAAFNASPTSGLSPLAVTFGDTSTGDIIVWSWDFGDGETSILSSPVHTYTVAGSYTVSLTVSGPGGTDTLVQPALIVVTDPGAIPGNVSCDGATNVIDALYIMQYEVGLRSGVRSCPLPPETLNISVCDVSGEAMCNVIDALYIMQCDVGIANPLCLACGPEVGDPVHDSETRGKRSVAQPSPAVPRSVDTSDLSAPGGNVTTDMSSPAGQALGTTLLLMVAVVVLGRTNVKRNTY